MLQPLPPAGALAGLLGAAVADGIDAALRELQNDAERGRLARAVAELAACDARAGAALARELSGLVERIGAAGTRRWIGTGLRAYARDPDALLAYFRLEDALAARSLAHEQAGAAFEPLRAALQAYLDGMLGAHLKLDSRAAASVNDPPLRPVLAHGGLFLPEAYSVLDAAETDALYRAACAHACAHLLHSAPRQDPGRLKPLSMALIGLVEDARVEHLLMRERPGLAALWGRFHRGGERRDELSFEALAERLALALHDPAYRDGNHWVEKGARLFRERLAAIEDPRPFREMASILANDLGQMRVRFLPQRHCIAPAYRDDNSFLWADAEPADPPPAQEALHLDAVRIDPGQARDDASVVRAAPAAEPAERRFAYPEWDWRLQAEREAWATVLEPAPSSPDPARGGRRRASPRSAFALARSRRLNRALRLTRQWEGEDLDLNAAVAAQVELRAGLAPDARVFRRPGRRAPRPAVLVLLDLSESTNDRLFGRYETVLDQVKAATLALGEAIEDDAERFAVHGFASDGRHRVRYQRVKDFDEPFDAARRERLRALRAGYSTRMGAAIRHAERLLAQQAGDPRALLIVTDGEPSDVDVDDPEYLVADAARAVCAAASRGVPAFCLSVAPASEPVLRRIFERNYLIVEDAGALPRQLPKVFARLLAR